MASLNTVRNQRVYVNTSARSWTCQHSIDPVIKTFHRSLPGYAPTPLTSLKSIAEQLGVKHVLMKDESHRFDLKAFKILGASWGAYRALAQRLGLPLTVSIRELGLAARIADIKLFAATDGNHGRAVARMAKYLDLEAHIVVPSIMDKVSQERIASEGALIEVVEGDYDLAVKIADQEAAVSGGLLIQDTAWPGYDEIPRWIVDGYSTMLQEIDKQVLEIAGKPADLVVFPVGVGSLAQAVITHYKNPALLTALLAVEADTAACLLASLENGAMTSVSTGDTIMCGLNCGTISSIAWPMLRDGIDATATVTDVEAHHAVCHLQSLGSSVGPCGAAPLAALEN
ncbi:MAG: hypothetical protein M1830_004052, partial [Pleopsidium flavum]